MFATRDNSQGIDKDFKLSFFYTTDRLHQSTFMIISRR